MFKQPLLGISKLFLLSALFFSNASCFSQSADSNFIRPFNFYGNWKCVMLDTRGYEKYSFEQAKKLQASILTIEKNTFYYHNIDFIDSCHFTHWRIKKYDTTEWNLNLSIKYFKKDLAKMFEIEALDNKGGAGCYNNCATFFLKDDTLINNCGGYYLYLLKVKTEK